MTTTSVSSSHTMRAPTSADIPAILDYAQALQSGAAQEAFYGTDDAAWVRPVLPSNLHPHVRDGVRTYVVDESLQPGGAFKVRGATAAVLQLCEQVPPPVRDTHRLSIGSAGNAANALAVAGRRAGFGVVACVPDAAAEPKVRALQANGAAVVRAGADVAAAIAQAHTLANDDPTVHFVHPYNQAEVIAGQATLVYETLDALEAADVDLFRASLTFSVVVGGGSLFAAHALVLHQARQQGRIGNNVRLFAAEVRDQSGDKSAPSLQWCDGTNAKTGTLAAQLQEDPMYCDGVVYVWPQAVRRAMRELTDYTGHLVEPAAAVGMAAVRSLAIDRPDVTYVTQVTGNKIAPQRYQALVAA